MAHWSSGGATGRVDEIYLVGGPLVRYSQAVGSALDSGTAGAGGVEAEVFLHEADSELAGKYLAATAQYQ